MARSHVERHHAEWLSLVETSGPFLTVPVLVRALSDGLDGLAGESSMLCVAYAEWRAELELGPRWVRWVLDELLGLRDAVSDVTDADPSHAVPEHAAVIRPSHVVRDLSAEGRPAVLLVHEYPADTALERPLPGAAWSASPIDRAAELARASGVELALVTNRSTWTLVWARPGQATGTCSWLSDIWLEEPITLRAFVTLLGARRWFSLPESEGLGRLLAEAAGAQQEVADRLGQQVRLAVELLIATLDRDDRESGESRLVELPAAEVYEGAVAVMMRLVFLFVAEERRLLPIDDPLYAETLAATTLRGQLQERADRDGEDPLERATGAWYRVLALFRAVHGGIEHDALRLPAYGGGLFDPDRHPFLEGRAKGTDWRHDDADPLEVDDRTMLHILDALQTLREGDARVQLSFRALDVEQIGHVYEGLLDHTAVRISDTALALRGRHEPELPLGTILRWATEGDDVLVAVLSEETGLSARAVTKALATPCDEDRRARLRAVCDTDDVLAAEIAPYHALLREDLRGDPLVFLPESLYVTQTLDRRSSGTYYTPRSLAEEVVAHALDPIAYAPGPAEEADRRRWRLRPADELLELRVADITMGSGAFLVAACRYLAGRLLEAWTEAGEHADPPAAAGLDELPADPLAREALAHRLVAERCLYGVDKNPMAVEMAKLSLWLVTLARDRPFSFVDHALRCGDSLLGVTDLRQLRRMHIDPGFARQASLHLGLDAVDGAVERALTLRRELEGFVVRDIPDAERKAALLSDAFEAIDDARLLGDLVIGAALAGVEDDDPLLSSETEREVATLLDPDVREDDRGVAHDALWDRSEGWLFERRAAVDEVPEEIWGDRVPFHWALEFPEVLARGGFDAIVGNPPFQGGQKITGALGPAYRDFLVEQIAGGRRGSADLVAYFFLRAATLIRPVGGFGLLATNTIGQGDTREVGLDQLTGQDWTINRAVSSQPWPGGANLEVATVWATPRDWQGERVLDGASVPEIAPSLSVRSRVSGNPHRLQANRGQSFQGTNVLGMGFVLSLEEAEAMLDADPRNEQVVKPYLVGEDLNSRPDGSPSRWVINFRDWPIARAREFALPFARVEELVHPERAANRYSEAARNRWWQFERRRVELYEAIGSLDRCIVITLVSKVVQPMFVPTGIVYAHATGVFAYDDNAHFGLLCSGFHWWWAVTHASTLETRVRYTPSDCFETFPQPSLTKAIHRLGGELDAHRTGLMLDRHEGLTKTYNRVHDSDEHADDITDLRNLHVELDHAVRDAYGWNDLELDHGFHETRFGTRFTFAPGPRQEVLDRLLELNHKRHAAEVGAGLPATRTPARSRVRSSAASTTIPMDV
jgi:hypothetical protein